MKIRIHHFFDIFRDFGSGKKIVPHPYLHAYHSVAELILNNPDITFELVTEADEVCKGCKHLINSVCDDGISHRKDFTKKEDFNTHLDKRIMEVCELDSSEKITPKMLCQVAYKYLRNIEFISGK